jgi:hypothetical protein
MPWQPVQLLPGMNAEKTPTLNTGGYTAMGFGRFKDGLFQKLGGWTRFASFNIDGIPKSMHTWQDLSGNKHIAIGTTADLDNIVSGIYTDIAPQILVTNPPVSFATTLGSNLVTIADTLVTNITTYDVVFFNTPVSVGGLILSGAYPVVANITPTSYQIAAAGVATATVVAPGGTIPTFTTTSGSSNFTMTLAGHGLPVGGDIVLPLATTVGGITILGRYIVQAVTDVNNVILTATNAASAAAGPTPMNGGAAGFKYYIAIGPQATSGGYGTGTYGSGGYGTGTAITGQTGADLTATDWSLDNWGELLIANAENDGIFYWGPASGFKNASIIATGPVYSAGAFVSIAQQIMISWGSTQIASIGVYQDPLLVKWSDVGNFFNWTATITNQAGEYRIPTGSKIMGGAATPQHNLIWTDTDLWLMTYIGATLVYGFNKIGSRVGLIAKHAHAQYGSVVYWMNPSNFFMYGGGADPVEMPCPVWDVVFQDLDVANQNKCFAAVNASFSEISWFYPSLSGGLGYPDKYVKFNTQTHEWDVGSLQRNCWVDASVFSNPLTVTQSGTIYAHESGMDADNTAMNPFFETGYFYISEGEEVVTIDRIYPDFKWGLYNGSQNASLQVSIKAVMYPGDTPITYGPFVVNQSSQYISKRIRARQIALRVESRDVGSFWRLGLVRFRVAPDGRR